MLDLTELRWDSSICPLASGHIYLSNSFLDFQVLARFMVILNLFLPTFTFLFILDVTKAPHLNICLGKGYLNFLTTKAQMCSGENPYANGICWVWAIILSIGNSKFQINTLVRMWRLLIKFNVVQKETLGIYKFVKISVIIQELKFCKIAYS